MWRVPTCLRELWLSSTAYQYLTHALLPSPPLYTSPSLPPSLSPSLLSSPSLPPIISLPPSLPLLPPYLALNQPDAKDSDIQVVRDILVDSLFAVLATAGQCLAICALLEASPCCFSHKHAMDSHSFLLPSPSLLSLPLLSPPPRYCPSDPLSPWQRC